MNRIVAELTIGKIDVMLELLGSSGRHVVDRFLQRLSDIGARNRSGTGIDDPIRQSEDESNASATFADGWSTEDARRVIHILTGLRDALSKDEWAVVDGKADGESVPGNRVSKDDPEARAERDSDRSPATELSGWISELEVNASRPAFLLNQNGITSDEQYREIETSFAPDQRLELAEVRFDHGLRQSVRKDAPGGIDLQILAIFVPPWIDNVPVQLASFPERGRNCFRAAEICTFDDLARIPLESMMLIKTFGRKTYQQISDALVNGLMGHAAALLREPAEESDDEFLHSQDTGIDFAEFSSVWSAILQRIGQKGEQEILTRRIGFRLPNGPETLETIGKSRGISRERVRQKQQRAIVRLHEDREFLKIRKNLEAELERQMTWSGSSVSLGSDCPVRALRGESFHTVKKFLQLVLESDYKALITKMDGDQEAARVVYGVSAEKLNEALAELKQFIVDHERDSSSVFFPRVLDYIRNKHHESIHADLKSFVDEWINWDYSSDPRIISFGDSIEAAAAAILERASRPLKLTELVDKARQDFGLDQTTPTIRNAVNLLCERPDPGQHDEVAVSVFQIGRSKFTTARHLPLDIEKLEYLVPKLERLIIKGRDCMIDGEAYQWHTHDLWIEMNRLMPESELAGFDQTMGWRSVDWLLRFYAPNGIVNLKRGRWARKIPGKNQSARTFHEAIVFILRECFPSQRGSRQDVLERLERLQSPGLPKMLTELKPPIAVDSREIWLMET